MRRTEPADAGDSRDVRMDLPPALRASRGRLVPIGPWAVNARASVQSSDLQTTGLPKSPLESLGTIACDVAIELMGLSHIESRLEDLGAREAPMFDGETEYREYPS